MRCMPAHSSTRSTHLKTRSHVYGQRDEGGAGVSQFSLIWEQQKWTIGLFNFRFFGQLSKLSLDVKYRVDYREMLL